MKTKILSFMAAATLALTCVATAGPSKTYQVTGPILEMSDTMIAVEKEMGKNERWEIARDASTKADGAMKVGDKVTITYTMTATKVEVKPDKSAGGTPSSGPAASPTKK